MISGAIPLFLLLGANFRVASSHSHITDRVPYIFANWSWKIDFTYKPEDESANSSHYEFHPKYSDSVLDESAYFASENQTITLDLVVNTTATPLTECRLQIVVQRDTEYFAWTNMTLVYHFREEFLGENKLFPNGKQEAHSSPGQKFLTRTAEIYECQSSIPVKIDDNVTITFTNMTFQAFEAESTPPADRMREICPRDYKSSIPIAALTGASLAVIVLSAVLIPGVSMLIARRRKQK